RRQTAVTLGLAAVVGLVGTLMIRAALEPSPWQRVYATREGEIGKRTSTGLVITPSSLFVALPHPAALGKHVEVRYGARAVVVPVLDVGPWNVDDAYWSASRRPAAEGAVGKYRRPSNRAGIDLSDAVFGELGLRDNDWVEWRFVHRGYLILPTL
ncbi:MAG TPA: hypothetical protein VGL86_03345, partial [Polyangia bacterium]